MGEREGGENEGLVKIVFIFENEEGSVMLLLLLASPAIIDSASIFCEISIILLRRKIKIPQKWLVNFLLMLLCCFIITLCCVVDFFFF